MRAIHLYVVFLIIATWSHLGFTQTDLDFFSECSEEAIDSFMNGDLSKAIQEAQTGLAEAESGSFFFRDKRTDICLSLLRLLYMNSGRYSDAEHVARRLFEKYRNRYGTNSTETAAVMAMLADALT